MPNLAGRFRQISKASLFLTEFWQDLYCYMKFSGVSPFQEKNKKLFYKLIIEAHAIEKGLSLPAPRSLFGREKIGFLIAASQRYDASLSPLPLQMIVGALETYSRLHRDRQVSDPMLDKIDAFTARMRSELNVTPNGGLRISPDKARPEAGPWEELAASRYSCRMFDTTRLERSVIEKLVSVAQASPSQCNRQATRAHFFQDRATIDELLRLQAGSAGFAREVGNLFVIAFDLAAWGGAQQRNQGYVDASLFAMTLMLTAHGMGLASCPLNLAVTHKTEREIRKVGGIPEDQRLVMMIAVGRPLPGTLKAARSPRRQVVDVLRFGDKAATANPVMAAAPALEDAGIRSAGVGS